MREWGLCVLAKTVEFGIFSYFPSMENICCFGLLRFGRSTACQMNFYAFAFFVSRFSFRSSSSSPHFAECAASLSRVPNGENTISKNEKLLNVRATPASGRPNVVVYVDRISLMETSKKQKMKMRMMAVYV